MEYAYTHQPKKLIVGLSVRTQMATASEDIGSIVARFHVEKWVEKISNLKDPTVFGCYSEYESDHMGPYTYTIGCEVTSVDSIPEGASLIEIPEGEFIEVGSYGPMPEALISKWIEIWNTDLPRAFEIDYENYGDANDSSEEKAVTIFLSKEIN